MPDREDVLIAVHNGVSATFLQHNKKRPGSGVREVALVDGASGALQLLSYKKVDKYSHQFGQGTGLFGDGWTVEEGELPDVASIPQSLMPGGTGGARNLETSPERAFLLHYLMVACPVVLVRPRDRSPKTQNCFVVPDVKDLRVFAMRLHRAATSQVRSFSNTYLGRIVGGAEEAALRFLIELRGLDAACSLGVSNFQVVAMGKVAWDSKQQNRSWIARVAPDHMKELGVFEAAASQLGRAKWIKTKKGDSFAVTESSVPELVAANLASGDHWCDHFRDLVANKQDFLNMGFHREGLQAMRDAIQDEEDQLVIRCFQEAWDVKRSALSKRAADEKADYYALVDGEREKIRNGLLRCRTADALANWLLRFAADARRKEPLDVMVRSGPALRRFLFNPRNADRLQNLLLFALVSSPSHDPSPRATPSKREA